MYIVKLKYLLSKEGIIIQLRETIPQGSIAREWMRGVVPLYAMPFPFKVVKGIQPNHKYAFIFVLAPLC